MKKPSLTEPLTGNALKEGFFYRARTVEEQSIPFNMCVICSYITRGSIQSTLYMFLAKPKRFLAAYIPLVMQYPIQPQRNKSAIQF